MLQPWSLTATVRDVAAGRVDAAALRQRALDRIDAVEPRIHAWVRLDDAPAPAATGPLAGIPVGIKDIVDVAGLPTECGSALRRGSAPATADAAVVRRLRAAGAVPIGKTVTTEFAYFAPGPTRNPAAPEHTPGGSSSGSAAAVAAGMVPLAVASQTAASLTRPAAYCGVAGLVLSVGTVPTDGVAGLSPSLDTLGLIAGTTGDLRTAWAAIVGGPDALRRALDPEPAASPRILLWEPTDLGDVEGSMRSALARAAGRLTAAGVEVTRLHPGGVFAELAADHAVIMAFEAARERRAELEQADRLSAPLAELLRGGAALPQAEYEAARERVHRAAAVVDGWLDGHDAVLGPAALGPAPLGIGATGSPILSRPWQVLGLPVVTVPGLRDPHGLPLGLQLVGRRGAEERLLAVAATVERSVGD